MDQQPDRLTNQLTDRLISYQVPFSGKSWPTSSNTSREKGEIQRVLQVSKNRELHFFNFLVADTRLYTLPCRSVDRYVGPSVRPSHFWIPSGFRITAPAKPSATGLPCIRPCFLTIYVKHFWVKKILVNLTQKLLIDSKRNADLGQEHR